MIQCRYPPLMAKNKLDLEEEMLIESPSMLDINLLA